MCCSCVVTAEHALCVLGWAGGGVGGGEDSGRRGLNTGLGGDRGQQGDNGVCERRLAATPRRQRQRPVIKAACQKQRCPWSCAAGKHHWGRQAAGGCVRDWLAAARHGAGRARSGRSEQKKSDLDGAQLAEVHSGRTKIMIVRGLGRRAGAPCGRSRSQQGKGGGKRGCVCGCMFVRACVCGRGVGVSGEDVHSAVRLHAALAGTRTAAQAAFAVQRERGDEQEIGKE